MRDSRRTIILAIAASLAVTGLALAAGCGTATTTGKAPAGAEATTAPATAAAEADTLTGPAPPTVVLKIVSPARKVATVRRPKITVRVEATDGAKVTVNGRPTRAKGGVNSITVSLKRGKNEFTIVAKKAGYDAAVATLTVRRKLSAAELAAQAAREREEFIASAKAIPYGELIKDPERYAGQKVKYYGEILQIQESDGVGIMLLYVTDLGYDIWTDQIWVDYLGHVKGVEGDQLTVYGLVTGTKSYETQIGGETYVPEVLAVYIDE